MTEQYVGMDQARDKAFAHPWLLAITLVLAGLILWQFDGITDGGPDGMGMVITSQGSSR